MTAQKHIQIAAAIAVAGWGALLIVVTRLVILGSFQRLEIDDSKLNVERAAAELDGVMDRLLSIAGDWAPWDDTYYFIQNANADYIENNLVDATLVNLSIDFMIFADLSGKLVHAKFLDPVTRTEISPPQADVARILSYGVLFRHDSLQDGRKGIALLENAPTMAASYPIIRTDVTGPIRGTLVVGRYLNEAEVSRISERTRLEVSILESHDKSIPPQAIRELDRPGVTRRLAAIPLDASRISGYMTFDDLDGKQAFVLRVSLPRSIFIQGRRSVMYFSAIMIGVGLVLMILLLVSVSHRLLIPLSRFSGAVSSLEPGREETGVGFSDRRDELGVLARAVNGLLSQIAENRKAMLDHSYSFGRAEMISNVLHNVRNTLAPLIGEMEILSGRLSAVPDRELRRAQEELYLESTPEDRREKLRHFLLVASGDLTILVREIRERLLLAGVNAVRMEETLNDCEKWAHGDLELERVPIAELTRESLERLDEKHRKRISLEWETAPDAAASVRANRFLLGRIIAALFACSAEAPRESGADRAVLRAELCFEGTGLGRQAHLRLRNDAAAYDEERTRKMFERRQYGRPVDEANLHWCANAMAMMNGALCVESEKEGRGTCYHMRLPA